MLKAEKNEGTNKNEGTDKNDVTHKNEEIAHGVPHFTPEFLFLATLNDGLHVHRYNYIRYSTQNLLTVRATYVRRKPVVYRS